MATSKCSGLMRGNVAKWRNSCTRSPYVFPRYSTGAKGPRHAPIVVNGPRAAATGHWSRTMGCRVVIQSNPHVGTEQSDCPMFWAIETKRS